MNELKIFNSPEFGQVRTLTIGGEPWFVGKDVAVALGYTNPQKAIRDHVDAEDMTVNDSFTVNGTKGILINESGLYSLVMGSKLPTAKQFKHWITGEVIPSIRKYGAYLTPEKVEEVLLNPDTLIKLATELKAEREARKNAELEAASAKQLIGELKPKADYTDRILSSKGTVPTTAIAKDYGMSAKAGVLAAGSEPTWQEDDFDYHNQKGFSIGRIFGVAKTQFKFDDKTLSDFGVINVITSSVDD